MTAPSPAIRTRRAQVRRVRAALERGTGRTGSKRAWAVEAARAVAALAGLTASTAALYLIAG